MNRRQKNGVYRKCVIIVICVVVFVILYKYLSTPSIIPENFDFDYPIDKGEHSKIKALNIAQNVMQKAFPNKDELQRSKVSSIDGGIYPPDWEALDKRPLPKWYDEAKIGIFIHWGVFSVPSFGSEWFWWNWKGKKAKYQKKTIKFMEDNYRPNFTYADFAPEFTAEFYNATEWADIFSKAGAKYVVLTSKHHEGYTNWPSEYSYSWNSVDVGPKRDLVGELGAALRKKNLKFGLYHSLYEWFHPLYLRDKKNHFKTQYFVRAKTLPELYELINVYKPDVIWSDGEWEAEDTYWNSTQFISWLYSYSPVKDTVVTNDRWGKSVRCKHGGFLGCSDRYNPGVLQKRKWENCMTIDKKSWGFRREAPLRDYYTIEELLQIIIETISCGGNILVNIGPAHDGTIGAIYLERLQQMGEWLNVNGEAIYSSVPWKFQKDTFTENVWYTKRIIGSKQFVYAVVLKWPKNNKLSLSAPVPSEQTTVNLVGYRTPLKWKKNTSGGLDIEIPFIPYSGLPCKWTWVFKISDLENS